MAQTSLSQSDAQAKIQQVDDAMTSAHKCVQNMHDNTVQMTSYSWLGNQAQMFTQKMQQCTEDMTTVVNHLTHVADTGKQNMIALVNQDHE